MKPGFKSNIPCWCGSNKKYKHCHKNRSQQERPSIGEFLEGPGNQFQLKYCSHPEASESNCDKIVKAHSISKSTGLDPILRDNHVYTFIPTKTKLLKSQGSIEPTLIGVNKASTFSGFCSYHDSSTFQPIDTQEFIFTHQHIFLWSYRSVCRELHAKSLHLKESSEFVSMDAGLPVEEQVQFQDNLARSKIGATKGIEEIKTLKKMYDMKLKTKDYNSLNSYIIWFEGVLPIVCSGTGQILYDAFKNPLQNLDDISIDSELTSFNIIPAPHGAVAIFAALGNCDVWKSVVDSLERVQNVETGDFLLNFTFSSFENVYASPTWWDSLSSATQEYLYKLMLNKADPFIPVEPPNFSDDFDFKTEWKALSRSILYAK